MAKSVKFGLFIAFIALNFMLVNSLASAYLCYQETTNKSTSSNGVCLLNYSGTYSTSDWIAWYPAIDENWSTCAPTSGWLEFTCSQLYVNYSKPNNAANSSIWQIKNGAGMTNYTIPKSCWDYGSSINFKIDIGDCGSNIYYCKNNSDWYQVASVGSSDFCEDSVYWDLPNYFGLCNSSLTQKYLNVSFKDENTLASINATINSQFVYFLDNIITNNTYSIINATENPSYAFCASPPHINLNVTYTMYYAASGYPQRTYSFDGQYTNVTTNTTLYLLSSSIGGYYTQQVLSSAGQPLSSVHVTAERISGSTYTTVGDGYTGDDGSITFWLDFNYQHRFTYEKEGYTTETRTVTPTASGSTVYLGSSSTSTTINDYTIGIIYDAKPDDDTLINNTLYNFNFTLTSTYWDVSSFGFVIKNASGSTLGSASAATNGGTVNTNVNTNNLSLILMNAYWIIDGNYTNVTFYWNIFNEQDIGWSLKTFFDDLKSFTGSGGSTGIFGLNEFSRTLLVFFIIFMIVGTMSYYSGVYSPAALIWAVFALVAFFDYGVGLIANPVEAISNFPTFFTLFLAIAITMWEASR